MSDGKALDAFKKSTRLLDVYGFIVDRIIKNEDGYWNVYAFHKNEFTPFWPGDKLSEVPLRKVRKWRSVVRKATMLSKNGEQFACYISKDGNPYIAEYPSTGNRPLIQTDAHIGEVIVRTENNGQKLTELFVLA